MATFKNVSKIVDGKLTSKIVEMTAEEEAAHKASIPTKAPRREGEFREFLSAFTTAEQIAIKTASMNPANVALALWYDKALGGATMALDHSETTGGLDALVAAGLITAARKTEILATDFDAL